MENSSNALLIAGSVLIALIIISALVFAVDKISNYGGTDSDVVREEQIEEFNRGYESYEKDLYGSELLSLINKAIDYNTNYVDEGFKEIEIQIKVKQGTGLNNENSIVQSDKQYSTKDKNSNSISNKLIYEIDKIKNNYNGEAYLKRLVSLYDTYNNNSGDAKNNAERNIEKILNDIGIGEEKIDDSKVKKEIQKYAEYVEFKRKKFKWTGTEYDEQGNGRLISMSYEEIR